MTSPKSKQTTDTYLVEVFFQNVHMRKLTITASNHHWTNDSTLLIVEHGTAKEFWIPQAALALFVIVRKEATNE